MDNSAVASQVQYTQKIILGYLKYKRSRKLKVQFYSQGFEGNEAVISMQVVLLFHMHGSCTNNMGAQKSLCSEGLWLLQNLGCRRNSSNYRWQTTETKAPRFLDESHVSPAHQMWACRPSINSGFVHLGAIHHLVNNYPKEAIKMQQYLQRSAGTLKGHSGCLYL